MAQQFTHPANLGANHRQTAGHCLQRRDCERFVPFAGVQQHIMPPIDRRQLTVNIRDGKKLHRQLMHRNVGPHFGDVIRIAPPIDAQSGFDSAVARGVQRLNRRQDPALGIQPAHN